MGRELAHRFLLLVSLPLCPYDVRGLFQGEGRLTVDYVQYRPWVSSSDKHFPFLFTTRYEDEINKRTTAENEFVMLKKVCG